MFCLVSRGKLVCVSVEEDARWLGLFALPNQVKITGRSSSITNSFVNGVIPVIAPSAHDIRAALEVLGMLEEVTCSYCGDVSTEWDHLRPLVEAQRPTGFVTEIQNLVPACGKCNQSKGNKHWKTWMFSGARLSPASRGIADIEARVRRLEAFENWREPTCVDFAALVSPGLWQQHWENHAKLLAEMRDAELVAAQIRAEVAAYSLSLRRNAGADRNIRN